MHDDDAPRVFTGRLELVAEAPAGFCAWRVVQVSPATAVGSIELSPPDGEGCVECRYSIVEKKGYVTEAIGGLIDWAFSQPGVRCIRAHAPARATSSIRALEKNGLSHVGDGQEPGTLRFELRRPD